MMNEMDVVKNKILNLFEKKEADWLSKEAIVGEFVWEYGVVIMVAALVQLSGEDGKLREVWNMTESTHYYGLVC
jgi:hypothetical protein